NGGNCGGGGDGGAVPGAGQPCDFVACGAGGRCQEDADGHPGCACVNGAVARTIQDGAGRSYATCEDQRLAFPDEDVAAAGLQPACNGFDCGVHGECFDMNGTPTCRCEQEFVATG